jgi:hypothetical protein
MPKLNEHRIVKRRNGFFPFNYEGGTIGMFQTYYVVEEWYAPNNYWDGIQLLLLLKRPMNGLKKLENVFINTMGIEYERSFYPYN